MDVALWCRLQSISAINDDEEACEVLIALVGVLGVGLCYPALGETRGVKAISYAALSAIIGFCMAYWSAAGNILTRLNVTPTPLTSVSDVANRMHKADRLSGISFEERWNAAPTPSTGTRDEQSQRETSWAETHIEKIPFSCELAFSRLVKTGNFSTRCIATADASRKLAAALPAGLPK